MSVCTGGTLNDRTYCGRYGKWRLFNRLPKTALRLLLNLNMFDLSPVDTVWFILFTPRDGWRKEPELHKHTVYCFIHASQMQMSAAPESLETPALLPVLLKLELKVCSPFLCPVIPLWFANWCCRADLVRFCCQQLRESATAALHCFINATVSAQVNLSTRQVKASWMVSRPQSVSEQTLCLV